MTDPRPAIDVADMTAVYHEQPVLWDVDLQVPSGVLMAIVGPNGAGQDHPDQMHSGVDRTGGRQRANPGEVVQGEPRSGGLCAAAR